MKIEDFVNVMNILGRSYGIDYDKETIKVWYGFFKNYDEKDFKSACREYISKNESKPTIASINKIIAKKHINIIPAEDEWEEVRRLIRKYGWPNEEKAMNEMKPLTRKIIKNYIGYQDLCSSTDTTWLKKDFISLYNQRAEEITNQYEIGYGVVDKLLEGE